MSKISNTINLLNLLSSGKKYTLTELSQELEVTKRMVRFYKEELDKAGIYIDTIRGPYGGYILKQNINIPNRKFTKNDINLLNEILINLTNENLCENLDILIKKINSIYIESRKNQKELILDNANLTKFNLFSKAIKDKRKVSITYDSKKHNETKRIIHPYDMFFYNNSWGVAAFCENKMDVRHFELNRILSYSLLNETYE